MTRNKLDYMDMSMTFRHNPSKGRTLREEPKGQLLCKDGSRVWRAEEPSWGTHHYLRWSGREQEVLF